jgi:hypothetical protein
MDTPWSLIYNGLSALIGVGLIIFWKPLARRMADDSEKLVSKLPELFPLKHPVDGVKLRLAITQFVLLVLAIGFAV